MQSHRYWHRPPVQEIYDPIVAVDRHVLRLLPLLYAHYAAIRDGPMVRRLAFDQSFRETNHRLILESRLIETYPPPAPPEPTAVARPAVAFRVGA